MSQLTLKARQSNVMWNQILAHCTALQDTPDILGYLGQSFSQLEKAIDNQDIPQYSNAVMAKIARAFDHYLECMTICNFMTCLRLPPQLEQLAQTKASLHESIKAGKLDSLLSNKSAGVLYLHVYTILGHRRITEEMVAHTNICLAGLKSTATTTCAKNQEHGNQTNGKAAEPCALDDKAFDCIWTALLDGMDNNDNPEHNENSNAGGSNKPPEMPLSDNKQEIVNSLAPMPAGARPLALATIKEHFRNVLCQLRLLHCQVDQDVEQDILCILNHLGRRLCMYPTGNLLKSWISDQTINKVCAAVWNVLGQQTALHRSRSIQSLLLIQTVILLLHQCGPCITSWLEQAQPNKEAPG